MKNFKVKSINKLKAIPTLDDGLQDAHVFIEFPKMETDHIKKRVNFVRHAYYGIEKEVQKEVQEVKETQQDESGNDIEVVVQEYIPPKFEVIKLATIPEKEALRNRHYDEQDVENVFSAIGTSITKSKGYFKGSIENIKPAILLDINNDPKFKNIGVESFEFV